MRLTRRGKIVFGSLWVMGLIAFYMWFPILPSWV